jgi:glycosyltransferase involved in cell wall biosynthesis
MEKNKPIKMMHIVFSLDMGGLETLVFDLVKRGNADRVKPSVCCLTKEGFFTDELSKREIEIFYLNKNEGVDFSLVFRLKEVLKRQKVDIVHIHDNSTIFYATLAAKMARIPKLIYTEHGGVYFESKRKYFLNKLLWRLQSRIICVSEKTKADLERFGSLNGKATVIPNGIDMKKFDINIDAYKKRNELGLNAEDFVICAVGRLSKEKNQKMLIEASKDLVSLIPQIKFLIAGDGPTRGELEDKTKQLGARDYFLFLGTRKDIPEILKVSDCFVNCSNYETFGLAIVEAMAAGIPVVATDAGGTNELVKNNQTGLLIEKDNQGQLCSAIKSLHEDKNLGLALAGKAEKFVREKFSIEVTVRDYEDIYQRS